MPGWFPKKMPIFHILFHSKLLVILVLGKKQSSKNGLKKSIAFSSFIQWHIFFIKGFKKRGKPWLNFTHNEK